MAGSETRTPTRSVPGAATSFEAGAATSPSEDPAPAAAAIVEVVDGWPAMSPGSAPVANGVEPVVPVVSPACATGAVSLSTIVTVPVPRPIAAPLGLDRTTVNVRSAPRSCRR